MAGKRGKIGVEYLVYILLALAGFVILVSIIGMTMRSCEKVKDLRQCHDALLAEELIYEKVIEKVPGVGEEAKTKKPWPMTCKTLGPITIDHKEEDMIKRQVAEMMSLCFWMLGESGRGGFDPFSEEWIMRKEKCFNCYIFKVKDIKNTEKKITKNDLNQYLLTNNIEGDPEKPTYWNYLRSKEGAHVSHLSIGDLPVALDDIVPGVYYAIVYQDFTSSQILGIPKDYQTDSVFLLEMNRAKECGEFEVSGD